MKKGALVTVTRTYHVYVEPEEMNQFEFIADTFGRIEFLFEDETQVNCIEQSIDRIEYE